MVSSFPEVLSIFNRFFLDVPSLENISHSGEGFPKKKSVLERTLLNLDLSSGVLANVGQLVLLKFIMYLHMFIINFTTFKDV